jgi:hypothetical protein
MRLNTLVTASVRASSSTGGSDLLVAAGVAPAAPEPPLSLLPAAHRFSPHAMTSSSSSGGDSAPDPSLS